MFNLNSSNPALNNTEAFNPFAYQDPNAAAVAPRTASLQGVVNKTAVLALMAIAAGAGGYWLFGQFGWSVITLSCLVGFVVTLGVYFLIARTPAKAHILGPVYAVAEGAFLGALTAGLESILIGQGIAVTGGLALQAFIITASALVAMLGLYSLRIVKPTRMFVSVLSTATVAIGITYLVSFVLSLFGIALPFISLGSAMQGGTPALIGIGLNVLILGIASLWLIVDFARIEEMIDAGAPKQSEWYGAFTMIVALAWVYYEAVKLVFRLALLFNSRD